MAVTDDWRGDYSATEVDSFRRFAEQAIKDMVPPPRGDVFSQLGEALGRCRPSKEPFAGQTVSKWFKTGGPSREAVKALATYLGISEERLLGRPEIERIERYGNFELAAEVALRNAPPDERADVVEAIETVRSRRHRSEDAAPAIWTSQINEERILARQRRLERLVERQEQPDPEKEAAGAPKMPRKKKEKAT